MGAAGYHPAEKGQQEGVPCPPWTAQTSKAHALFDRSPQGAYDAFAAGLLSLPSSLFETLSAHSLTKSPTAVFDLQAPPTSIFFSLLNRLTIVGHFDLGLPSAMISARSLLSAEGRTVVDGAVGLALEYQLHVLGAAYGKDGIARLAGDLLSDAEAIYTTELHPVRRLRCVIQLFTNLSAFADAR